MTVKSYVGFHFAKQQQITYMGVCAHTYTVYKGLREDLGATHLISGERIVGEGRRTFTFFLNQPSCGLFHFLQAYMNVVIKRKINRVHYKAGFQVIFSTFIHRASSFQG